MVSVIQVPTPEHLQEALSVVLNNDTSSLETPRPQLGLLQKSEKWNPDQWDIFA